MRGSGPSHSLRAQRAEYWKAGIRPVSLALPRAADGGSGGPAGVLNLRPKRLASTASYKAPNRKNARFGAFLWDLPRAQTSVIFSAGLKWPRGWPQTGQNSGGSVPSCTRPQTVQIQRMGCALR